MRAALAEWGRGVIAASVALQLVDETFYLALCLPAEAMEAKAAQRYVPLLIDYEMAKLDIALDLSDRQLGYQFVYLASL